MSWEHHSVASGDTAISLDPGLMVEDLYSGDRMGAIKELVDRLHATGYVADSLGFLQSVLDREDLESTVLGPGVAFPHARCRSVDRLGVAVGISRKGVLFHSDLFPDKVHSVCLLAVPPAGEGDYLEVLGRLAAMFKDGVFRTRLQACARAGEMCDLLGRHLQVSGSHTPRVPEHLP